MSWLSPRIGLAIVVAFLAAPLARAEEPEAVAQAGEPEPRVETPSPPDEPAPAAKPAADQPAGAKPAIPQGIEEIVVQGGESEAASDFENADSVTGFGAEDLAALGVQSVADLAAFTPNLEIVTYGATSPTFFIRGVGLNDFNSNSTGAVAIYQDDVPINAPAMQIPTLFDVDTVNILRGPQGTGLARNASAGAIKVYSRKPTGEFGGFLRSEFGNFNARDFEGAVEAPIYQDLVAGRLAFRFSQRDGTMQNRCGNAPPMDQRVPVPQSSQLRQLGKNSTDAPWSICGEPVDQGVPTGTPPGTMIPNISRIPVGLPGWVNNVDNWAARGTLLIQPTLDMNWLVNAHGSRRNELTRLGQSIGTRGSTCANDDAGCLPGNPNFIDGSLGGGQGVSAPSYVSREITARLLQLAPCTAPAPLFQGGTCEVGPGNPLFQPGNQKLFNDAKIQVANELSEHLDSEPWKGDFNICGLNRDQATGQFVDRDPTGTYCKKNRGRTLNDTYGTYIRGDIALPWGLQLFSITGYDHYKRYLSIDLDMSPETLFQIQTNDDGWDLSQSVQLGGQLGDESPVHWDVGGWLLREQLNVNVVNDLGILTGIGVGTRDYTQDLWSGGTFASLSFDFWDDFTLDGGVRYNWEEKKLDYTLLQGGDLRPQKLNDTWTAPTGTVRLTYRFREDTHAYWKYTRGWKPGTYNATSSPVTGVSTATPETIDAFETGMRGSWLDGRLGLDLSLFYYNYKDYQLFTAQQFAGGQPEFVILNASSAVVYGAEVDAVARPWPGAFGNVRFGWLESQFLDFVQVQQDIIIVNGNQVIVNRELQNTGNPLLNSPRFKVSLTGEQTFPIGRWGTVTTRYDGVWTAESFYDAARGRGIPNDQNVNFLRQATIGQPSFWIHNARLAYRPPGGHVEIAGFVRNITNKAYKTFGFDASTFNGTSVYFVGDPRTFGGSVTVTF